MPAMTYGLRMRSARRGYTLGTYGIAGWSASEAQEPTGPWSGQAEWARLVYDVAEHTWMFPRCECRLPAIRVYKLQHWPTVAI